MVRARGAGVAPLTGEYPGPGSGVSRMSTRWAYLPVSELHPQSRAVFDRKGWG